MLTSRIRCYLFPHPLLLPLIDKQDGFTPVYAASQIGQRDIVDLLIKAGADIHLASVKVYTQCNIFHLLIHA